MAWLGDQPGTNPAAREARGPEPGTPGPFRENDALLACVDRVRKATQGRGIWVADRGGERRLRVSEVGAML
jgi:hypothetical protein